MNEQYKQVSSTIDYGRVHCQFMKTCEPLTAKIRSC